MLLPLQREVGLQVSDLLSWLVGEMTAERSAFIDGVMDAWRVNEHADVAAIATIVLHYAQQHRYRASSAPAFNVLREAVAGQVEKIEAIAADLGETYTRPIHELHRSLDQLRRLRIAVLGEFKRGKSTLINALLQRPGFMPTDTLPSTSAIIEIISESPDRFEQLVDLDSGRYETKTRDEFYKQAGDADERSRRAAKGEEGDIEGMPRWRVRTPFEFLQSAEIVTIVDTPGLNEDPIRDKLAREEAHRAHAAILVLSASQLLSSFEQEVADQLASKIRGLVVVINRIDEVTEEQVPRLRSRVLDHLGALGLREDQIMTLNAREIERHLEAGASPESIDGLVHLHDRITDVALRNIMPLRVTRLQESVSSFIEEIHAKLALNSAHLRATAEEMQKEEAAQKKKREKAQEDIRNLERDMCRRGQYAATELRQKFEAAWPRILANLEKKKDNWKSDHNSLFSPKLAAQDIAKCAQHDLTANIEGWATTEFKRTVEPALADAIDSNRHRLDALAEYLNDVTGMDKSTVHEQVLKKAMSHLLGDRVDVDNIGGEWAAVLSAVVSLVVGYIVADVILYYMLSMIAGFLNPFLLAAAAVAGLVAFAVGGKAAVTSYIRSKIAEKIVGKLGEPDVQDRIASGLHDKTYEIFESFGQEFSSTATSYLTEADHHLQELTELAASSKQRKDEFREAATRMVRSLDDLRILLPINSIGAA